MRQLTNEVLAQKPPATLYHYTTQRGLIGILASKALWASKMQYLNDASEFQHALDIGKEIITKRKKAPKSDSEAELLEKIEGALQIIYSVHLFVGSLSEAGDLLSQWRGYCPEGNGFSIGFNSEQLQNALKEQQFGLAPCVYEKLKQEQIIEELFDDALGFTATSSEGIFSPQLNPGLAKFSERWGPQTSFFMREFLQLGSLLKHDSFSEEREWRILCFVIPHTHPDFRIRPGKSMLIPYREVKMHSADGTLHIDELIVGPTPHSILAKQSAHTLLSLNSIPTTMRTVRSSRIPYRAW